MDWNLGTSGLLYLAAMSIGFGLLAQLLAWRAAPKWLWALVSGLYFGVGILVSEFWFGWATEEDLQPNIDGLSRDEVLLIGLVPVAFAVAVTRWMARRHARQRCSRVRGIIGKQSRATDAARIVTGHRPSHRRRPV